MAAATSAPAALCSLRAIASVALPASLLRVSALLGATAQSAIIGRMGGSTMLASFAAVWVTLRTAVLLFNFFDAGAASRIGHAASRQDVALLTARARLYLGSACLLGLASGAALRAGRPLVFRLLRLAPAVEREAAPFYAACCLLMPLLVLNLSISGMLQGLRAVGLCAALEAAQAALETAGTLAVLSGRLPLPGSCHLLGVALAKAAAGTAYAAAGLLALLCLAPAPLLDGSSMLVWQRWRHGRTAEGTLQQRLLPTSDTGSYEQAEAGADVQGRPGALPAAAAHVGAPPAEDALPSASTMAPQQGPAAAHLLGPLLQELAWDGSSLAIRAAVLHGSVFLLAAAASRLGTAPLAAHHVATQLWMLPSHASAGLVSAGVVLGCRVLAGCEGEQPAGSAGAAAAEERGHDLRAWRQLCWLLCALGLACGALTIAALVAAQRPLVSAFTRDATVAGLLEGLLWAVLCTVVLVTSVLWPLNGLVFATQLFSFVRNLQLAGLALFLPSLWVAYSYWGSLAALWVAKAVLYVWLVVLESAGVAAATHRLAQQCG